jgi:hypothetical protein
LPVDVDIGFVFPACRYLLVMDVEHNTCGFSHLSPHEYFESCVRTTSQAHAFVAKTLSGAVVRRRTAENRVNSNTSRN